jgi:tyrosine decarboxylase/aspartate 1-decarboxylase
LPLVPGGEFAQGLRSGRAAALELDGRLREDGRFEALAGCTPDLDIVVWKVKAESPERASELAQQVFDACATRDLHLALVQLPQFWFDPAAGVGVVTCLRSVLMKPEHLEWLDRVWERLSAACGEVLGA